MEYNKSGRLGPWVFVSWKTTWSKRPDLLYSIYVAWIAQKTFLFAYDATMSLYNIASKVVLIIVHSVR